MWREVRLEGRRLKFVLLGFGVLAAMGFLLAVGIKQPGGFTYYMTVGEYLSHPKDGKGLRVNGRVTPGSIMRLQTGLDVRFRMTDGTATLPVAYHGIIPDTFVDGADVVVEGSLGPDGTFRAHHLLAKCPSKYEAAEKAQQKA